uniref:Uncharacterized protein n=1 Tax=Arundo donax TaxID=35708 RepID=A0A0A9CMG1_ARUDO
MGRILVVSSKSPKRPEKSWFQVSRNWIACKAQRSRGTRSLASAVLFSHAALASAIIRTFVASSSGSTGPFFLLRASTGSLGRSLFQLNGSVCVSIYPPITSEKLLLPATRSIPRRSR